jgi:hypothetical protein
MEGALLFLTGAFVRLELQHCYRTLPYVLTIRFDTPAGLISTAIGSNRGSRKFRILTSAYGV